MSARLCYLDDILKSAEFPTTTNQMFTRYESQQGMQDFGQLKHFHSDPRAIGPASLFIPEGG